MLFFYAETTAEFHGSHTSSEKHTSVHSLLGWHIAIYNSHSYYYYVKCNLQNNEDSLMEQLYGLSRPEYINFVHKKESKAEPEPYHPQPLLK